VRLLARHGVDVARPMRDGRCPIEVAAADGNEGMVAALVDAGERRAELTGRTGWSGDIATARMLLDLGADPTPRDDRFDATPQGWAEHAQQDAYVAFMAEYARAQR
jgi:ankyrin repeat protein